MSRIRAAFGWTFVLALCVIVGHGQPLFAAADDLVLEVAAGDWYGKTLYEYLATPGVVATEMADEDPQSDLADLKADEAPQSD